MKRKQERKPIGSWPQIIEFTEEKLQQTRRKAAQLEEMLAMFRQLAKAGSPSPADLAEGK